MEGGYKASSGIPRPPLEDASHPNVSLQEWLRPSEGVTCSFPSQAAMSTGRPRAIYLHRGLAGKVMAIHSSPSARHLARHRSISYSEVRSSGDGTGGGCITAVM